MGYARIEMIVALLLFAGVSVSAQDRIILHDIGPYKWLHTGGCGPGVSIVVAAGRAADPGDEGCSADYADPGRSVFVTVKASKHGNRAWLLHEMEGRMRTGTREGFPRSQSIVGAPDQRRFQSLEQTPLNAGGNVGWVSGDATIVDIEFTFSGTGRTAEIPTEVVDAYLGLYPSSMPGSIADTPEHHTQWIRNEMRRLLEYATRDVSVARLPAADPQDSRAEEAQGRIEGWLKALAEYRERFYGVGSGAQVGYEIMLAEADHTNRQTGKLEPAGYVTWLENRLNEFRTWWAAHQNDPVMLPAPGTPPRPTSTVRLPMVAGGAPTPTSTPQ